MNTDELRKDKIFKSSDKELVEIVFDKTISSNQDAVTAQSELTRRQMEELRRFNTSSTVLACIMILMALIQVGVAIVGVAIVNRK